jgi:hypothetical protein
MPYDAFVVDGTQLKVTISASPTLIPGVQSFSGPTGTKTTIEYTAISDTAKKKKGGKPDFGTVTFTIAWDPADTTHAYLLTAYNTAGSTDTFTILCSDAGAATMVFSGSVTGFAWKFDKDAVSLVDVTVEVSGAVVVTP